MEQSGTSSGSKEHGRNHDRLVRARSLNFGGGIAFQVTEKLGVFATYGKLAWGQNIPAPRSITVGMHWGFNTGRSAARANPSLIGPIGFQ